MYRLNINKENGMYYCFRCTSKGSWIDFRGKILGVNVGSMQRDEGSSIVPFNTIQVIYYEDID
jgi:hypothetical protein